MSNFQKFWFSEGMNRGYRLAELSSKKDIRDFHDLPASINRGDKNWIKPLFKDIETIFHPSSNKLLRTG
jgi:hypothetical protein